MASQSVLPVFFRPLPPRPFLYFRPSEWPGAGFVILGLFQDFGLSAASPIERYYFFPLVGSFRFFTSYPALVPESTVSGRSRVSLSPGFPAFFAMSLRETGCQEFFSDPLSLGGGKNLENTLGHSGSASRSVFFQTLVIPPSSRSCFVALESGV